MAREEGKSKPGEEQRSVVQAKEEAGPEEGVVNPPGSGPASELGRGAEFAKARGVKLDGDLRELLAEVQGEKWLRFVEPNHEGCACLAKQFRFYSEGNGEPVHIFKPKRDTIQCAMYAF